MRHGVKVFFMWLLALNVGAALWIFIFRDDPSLLRPASVFFGLEIVAAVILLLLSPFIWAWLVAVLTIGAGVSIGNLHSDRVIRNRDESSRGLGSDRLQVREFPEGRGRARFQELEMTTAASNQRPMGCPRCGQTLRTSDRFCSICGLGVHDPSAH